MRSPFLEWGRGGGGDSGVLGSHLNQEHGPRRDLHVVPKLEVREEGYRLRHANVPVDLETYVGDGLSR